MQSIQRSRELIIHDRTAISNHIRSLLLEFGIVIPKGLASLRQRVPLALEDAEMDCQWHTGLRYIECSFDLER